MGDPCHGQDSHNLQTIGLTGIHGSVVIDLHGNTALNRPNTAQYLLRSGIYSNWDFSKDAMLAISCTAPSNQYILSMAVYLCNK